MLAIAANTFDHPSETFIRAHVRCIAPSSTVLVCHVDGGTVQLASPVLSDIFGRSKPRNLGERIVNALRFRWWRYVDPALRGTDEARIRRFLLRHGVTAVLAEYGSNGCFLRLACKRAQIPLYVHFHGYDATKLARDPNWRRHYRTLFKDAAGVIAPSEFLANRLEVLGCSPSKLHVSPCGIDVPLTPRNEGGPPIFIAVGRLVEKKSPVDTLKAFARVVERVNEASLDVVGDGPLMKECLTAADRLGVAERVRFHGALPHDKVLKLMRNSFAFVQHSVEAPDGDCEGLPVAILEAMGMGLPVVSTRHSGIPEAVAEGETGFLVAEHDVEGMAEAMMALLKDRSRANAMGRAGRARVEDRFTQDRTAARLREIMRLKD